MNDHLFKNELSRLSENIPFLQPNTPIFQYIHWLNLLAEEKDPKFVSDYLPIVRQAEDANTNKPFLSVITRTQGTRPETLMQALESLAAQTDNDFEILLIGHKLNANGKNSVEAILQQLSPEFLARIRFLTLDYGNRTTPLNFAFAHAYGQYAAVLDDDDIVFENWVETFHRTAEAVPGKIIHSYAYKQSWRSETMDDGQTRLSPCSEYDDRYCVNYSLLKQIEDNHCPLMTLAFPTIYFKKLGLIFDESLSTTEDWDYFMRLSFLCGVEDVPAATAVYRFWENTENSASVHQLKEWQENFELIQSKFLNMPILIPQGQKKRQILVIDNTQPTPALRTLLKDKLHSFIPEGLWNFFKKCYHAIKK